MTHLSDLMSVEDLRVEIVGGYVRQRHHPDAALSILNYTEKAQYERHWNDVTLQCRGLVIDSATHEVLARPFSKFFNYGEHPEGSLPLDAWATVADKLDGSLGILYPAPDGWAIATRGSFTSEQAAWATAHLRERYAVRDGSPCTMWAPEPGLTYLFEIIYPENRIVLDYGTEESLVLIGTRDIEGGGYCAASEYDAGWPGEVAPQLEARTLREALALKPRENAEGVVVLIHEGETMVKIKQEDYVRLHKLVTGLNERAVWEHLSIHDGTWTGLLESVPDEFHDWVNVVARKLNSDYDNIYSRAYFTFNETIDWADSTWGGNFPVNHAWERRVFAERAKEHGELTPLLFQMLDGRDISPAIWKMLKPKGETVSLMDRNEDNS